MTFCETYHHSIGSVALMPSPNHRGIPKSGQFRQSTVDVFLDKLENLPKLFSRFRSNLSIRRECPTDKNKTPQKSKQLKIVQHTPAPADHPYPSWSAAEEDLHERSTRVGAKIRVYWSDVDAKDSNWESGWYQAIVQDYQEKEDAIAVTYDHKPQQVYYMDV